jgi:hypothetical protein
VGLGLRPAAPGPAARASAPRACGAPLRPISAEERRRGVRASGSGRGRAGADGAFWGEFVATAPPRG